ncbi:FadR/GntR family transcriptional regulator [Clostridium sp. AN503]|uniref:FadR/GntR family transcriptional regulator n=1 Tax=Clostridium sp. AN503 TaxID=3160598 RepID=UPI0034581CBB
MRQDFDNKRPLADTVADEIKEYIIQQNLKGGDKIPPAPELAELFGVGRSTIREAVKSLAFSNILEVRHGAGTFVSPRMGVSNDPLGMDFIKDKQKLAHDLMEIRLIIEPPIAAMAAKNATEKGIEELSQIHDILKKKVELEEEYIEDDIAFHKKIAELSNNIVVPNLTPLIAEAVNYFTIRTKRQLKKETIQMHMELMEAIRTHDSLWAEDAMRLHLIYNREYFRNLEMDENYSVNE